MTIQQAIDLAVEKNSNVLMPCSMSNKEIRASIADPKGCYIFWDTGKRKGEKILIVPPAYHDTLGGTGPIIRISSLDRIHQGRD